MPTRDIAPIGAPCWIDLMTSDKDRAREFYCQLFDWSTEAPKEDFGGYFFFTKNGVPVAGCIGSRPGSSAPDVWSIYLATDDADRTIGAMAAQGGQPLVTSTPIGGLGTMAYATDPGGAGIGIWQPGSHLGFGLIGEAGAPAWFELYTPEYEASVEFYRNVFHLETEVGSDTDEFRYTTLGTGETQVAGIMDASTILGEGDRGQWTVYFGVADADATLARIAELGGAVTQPAEDTPYGRLAAATDPAGAAFKLIAMT